MAKPMKLKEAQRMLTSEGCVLVRTGSHEVWKRADGRTFALPAAVRKVSAGVVRKLTYFVSGELNYTRR